MSTLDQIQHPIADQIRHYEQFISDSLQSESAYVSSICNYILAHRGKQMRPLLTLLAAALHGEIDSRSYMGASLVEMIHTASLMHDDVVDEAYVRRSSPSVNALWRAHTAVLIGDFIFARSYHICMQNGGADMLTEVTRAIHELSEGELIQTEQSEALTMTRPLYFEIIYKKTASLLGASAAIGAISVGATPQQIQAMRTFGDKLGVAFQIKDDILDFSPAEVIGKPSCGDLRERKITLPLLYVLEQSSVRERDRLIGLLSEVRHRSENVELLTQAVIDGGGLTHAEKSMEIYRNEALEALAPYPEGPIKESLRAFADFALARKS